MGPLMDHKNGHISTNIQHQKLSIAVLEAAHEGPSHGALDWAVFSIKRPPKSKKVPPGPGISFPYVPECPGPGHPLIYRYGYPIYTYIYIYIHVCQHVHRYIYIMYISIKWPVIHVISFLLGSSICFLILNTPPRAFKGRALMGPPGA